MNGAQGGSRDEGGGGVNGPRPIRMSQGRVSRDCPWREPGFARPVAVALLAIALLAFPPLPAAQAESLHPDRFGISTARRGRLFLSPDKTTPGFDRIAADLVLFSPDGAFGPGRSVKVETPDGRAGYAEGRHLASFDRRGLYLADLSRRTVRIIRGVRGDADLMPAGPARAFALDRATGRLHAIDPRDGTVTLLFPGDDPAEARELLDASPDGRFAVLRTLLSGARAEVACRIVDAQTRDTVTIPAVDATPFSWGNGTRILWGPFPGDGRVRLSAPETLLRDLRSAALDDPAPRRGEPRYRDAALSPCGTRGFRLADDGTLEVFEPAGETPVYDAREVSAARFTRDGRLVIRRPTGFTLVSRDGATTGGPWHGGSPRDLPVVSPAGQHLMLVSQVGRDTRFRVAVDLKDGRVIHALSERGGEPVLMNPLLSADGRAVYADGLRLDLATGIVWEDPLLAGFRPARLSPHADLYLSFDRDGRFRFVAPATGATVATLPFPGGFEPVYLADPCFVLLAPRGAGKPGL